MAEGFFDEAYHEELRDRFLGGGCHALALGLAERTGWDLAIVWVSRGRRREISHAMAVVPGDEELYLDIGGMRTSAFRP